MQLKAIKSGKWYQTTHGVGKAISVGGTHPPSVSFDIVSPVPRGKLFLRPRDVLHEITPPAATPNWQARTRPEATP